MAAIIMSVLLAFSVFQRSNIRFAVPVPVSWY